MLRNLLAVGIFSVLIQASEAKADYISACLVDIQTYCTEVVPGDGRISACLYAHSHTISDSCYAETADISTQIELLFDLLLSVTAACQPDVETLCTEVAAGNAERFMCLKDNKADLSQVCSDKLDNLMSVPKP